MRILYLCADIGVPVLGCKGASVHVRSLATALYRAGHSIVLAAPVLNKSSWLRPAFLPFPVIQVPPAAESIAVANAIEEFTEAVGTTNAIPSDVRRMAYHRELLRELKRRFHFDPPDFIYERAARFASTGVVLAAELGLPLILELNAPLADEHALYRGSGLDELAARAEQWTLSHADAVLAVSRSLADHAVALGAEPHRVHVVPNGVDAALFRPRARDAAVRAKYGLNGGTILGFVGGFRPWHGANLLPELLKRLLVRHRELQLVVVGDGPMRPQFERALREHDMAKHAMVTGALAQENVAELVAQFDVALAPYPHPDHAFYFSPLKLFEYMACGVPVVAAELGQICEIVRDGENGLLYPADDLAALVDACERLLADPALRARLGRAAAREIHGRYTWDRNAARVIEIVQSLPSGATQSVHPGQSLECCGTVPEAVP